MKLPLMLFLLLVAFMAIAIAAITTQDPGLLIGSKLAFLIAAIFQFVIAIALFCGAYSFYLKKVKGVRGRKPFWVCIVYVMIILGMFFLAGAYVAFTHYITMLEIIHGREWSELV